MNRLLLAIISCALGLSAAGCHTGNGAARSYVVSGTAIGLTANGLVLTDNGADSLAVPANASSFQFSQQVEAGGSYDVAVATQPTGLTCSVTQGSRGNLEATVSDVTVSCAPETYVISGTIKGLTSSGLTLQDSGGDDLTVLANSNSFEFSSPVAYGGNYDVTISAQPAGLTCTVSQGTGIDVSATVNDIAIACNVITYTIGGTITGLTASGLTLEDNGGDALTVAANATSFQFTESVAAGGAYDVTVTTQPTGLTCSVSQGTGSNLRANAGTAQVTCDTSSFTISGTISGLTAGGLVLQNNGGDNLAVSSDSSSFSFATPVAYGGAYDVTVLNQPTGQTCTVSSESGSATQTVNDVSVSCVTNPTYTVVPSAGANGTILPSTPQTVNPGGSITFTAVPDTGFAVDQWLVNGSAAQTGGSVYSLTNVSTNDTVQVTFAQATLSLSLSSLALSVDDTTLNTSLTGTPRQITVTNAGSIAATDLVVSPSGALPSGTTLATTCGATLAASDSCTITITPGSVATSDCGSGTALTPDAVSVSADDATTSQADVSVLSFGCIYEGGYVYSIDDTAPATGSVGGAVAAETDASAEIHWYNDAFRVTGATSVSDGETNTATIIAVQGAGSYAAALCAESAQDGYTDWYLPAQNELGLVYTNLASYSLGNFSTNRYWSSTEANDDFAWGEAFSGSGAALSYLKTALLGVRCVRKTN